MRELSQPTRFFRILGTLSVFNAGGKDLIWQDFKDLYSIYFHIQFELTCLENIRLCTQYARRCTDKKIHIPAETVDI